MIQLCTVTLHSIRTLTCPGMTSSDSSFAAFTSPLAKESIAPDHIKSNINKRSIERSSRRNLFIVNEYSIPKYVDGVFDYYDLFQLRDVHIINRNTERHTYV